MSMFLDTAKIKVINGDDGQAFRRENIPNGGPLGW